MWTLKDIENYCNEISAKVNDTFTCPVKLNGRITRTLGRVISHKVNGMWEPEVLEISKQLLETSSDESVKAVIEHEWCHYYVTKTTGENHGHDATFKAACAKIGCTNDGVSTTVERTVSDSTLYKYQVFCPTCDKFICNRRRKVEWMDRMDECWCPTCKGKGLVLIQNW